MTRGARWTLHVAVAGTLAAIQVHLLPLLMFKGRGIRPILTPDEAGLLAPLVFVLVLLACWRPALRDRDTALWYCAWRSLLWGAVLTLIFFEAYCCGALRFEEVPPSREFHWGAVRLYFAMMWSLSFAILSIDVVRKSPMWTPSA